MASLTSTRAASPRGPTEYETSDAEVDELQSAAAVALIVLRRALVEGAALTRETVLHEAAITFGAARQEAARRLDAQAQRVGVSSLF
ncbi:MAG TPA: hypothetical protein VMA83_08825 [Solirubrobacteraceae bacterium]|nr:hypothetical protein [Solirubrobacteraceae bacterium]